MSCADLGHLRYRATQKRALRKYLDTAGIIEVDVPLLARNACPDPYVEPLSFLWEGQRVFLQPSPELFLKRLLTQHPCDMYSLGPCFRNDPSTSRHNPEFLMLEFYLIGQQRYKECQQRSCEIVQLFAPGYPFKYWDYESLWRHYLHQWPQTREDYLEIFEENHKEFPRHWCLQNYHDLLFAEFIQPHLGQEEITVIENFPPQQAALAQINQQSGKAIRFEIFLHGTEVANGYHELIDPLQNTHRFEQWRMQRQQDQQLYWDDDGKFLAALPHMPACSGVAIGIERLILLGAQKDNIAYSIPFSWADC